MSSRPPETRARGREDKAAIPPRKNLSHNSSAVRKTSKRVAESSKESEK